MLLTERRKKMQEIAIAGNLIASISYEDALDRDTIDLSDELRKKLIEEAEGKNAQYIIFSTMQLKGRTNSSAENYVMQAEIFCDQ